MPKISTQQKAACLAQHLRDGQFYRLQEERNRKVIKLAGQMMIRLGFEQKSDILNAVLIDQMCRERLRVLDEPLVHC